MGRYLGVILASFLSILSLIQLQGCASCSSSLGGDGDETAIIDGTVVDLEDLQIAEGTVVGKLVLSAPANEAGEFVVRGNLPIPANLYPRKDGRNPFAIEDVGGTLIDAQVEIVSRYPNSNDNADVVELLARVHRKPANPGDLIDYNVVIRYHDATVVDAGLNAVGQLLKTQLLPASITALLNQSSPLKLRGYDYYGNLYEADLLDSNNLEVLRVGPFATQVRTHTTMMPVAGKSNPANQLPHLFGVHAYLTSWSGEAALSLDLRIHNGPAGDNGIKPNGRTYFLSLALLLPNNFSVQQQAGDPFFRNCTTPSNPSNPSFPCSDSGDGFTYNVLPIVDRIKDGDTKTMQYIYTDPVTYVQQTLSKTLYNVEGMMHVMPSQGQLQRRLVLFENGFTNGATRLLNDENLAFARAGKNAAGDDLFSWSNPTTARFFPQRQQLPELDYIDLETQQAALVSQSQAINNYLTTGVQSAAPYFSPVQTVVLGPFHPWGVAYGGMTSGTEIDFFAGVSTVAAASSIGYQFLENLHRMNTDRQPSALFQSNGRPAHLDDYLMTNNEGQKYFPYTFYMAPKIDAYYPDADPFGYNKIPAAALNQLAAVEAAGKHPGYTAEILSYQAHDLQHLTRYTRLARALAWIGNDALAKDDLKMQAALFRMSYREYSNSSLVPDEFKQIACNNNYQQSPTGLLIDMLEAKDIGKGAGIDVGRGEGWGFDATAAAYSLADESLRQNYKPWIDLIVDAMIEAQSPCSGVFGRYYIAGKLLGGKYYGVQIFEEVIVQHGLKGFLESVLRGADPQRAYDLSKALDLAYTKLATGPAWLDSQNIFAHQLAVAPLKDSAGKSLGYGYGCENSVPVSFAENLFCDAIPSDGTYANDNWQTWILLANGYESTQDKLFLDRAAKMLDANSDLNVTEQALAIDITNKLQNSMQGYYLEENLPRRATLLAVTQEKAKN